jgi:hypothetical protein
LQQWNPFGQRKKLAGSQTKTKIRSYQKGLREGTDMTKIREINATKRDGVCTAELLKFQI